MKTIRFLFTCLLPLGLMISLFQGCYTQLATTHEEESSYKQEDLSDQQEEQPAQSESYGYDDNYDNWRSHNYIGFSYYYPTLRSYWGWDGCNYPTYWDPWWTPSVYPYSTYYPYHMNGWYSYPGSAYYSIPYGYSYTTRPYVTRNSGYQRGGNSQRIYGVVRSRTTENTGTETTVDGRVGSTGGSMSLPRAASTSIPQSSSGVVRSNQRGSTTSGTSSSSVTTSRSPRGDYRPSVQQPRHRSESTTRVGGSSRQKSSSRGNSGATGRSSQQSTPAPSYNTSPPQRTSSPQSAPAPRNESNEQRSSSSGRSRR